MSAKVVAISAPRKPGVSLPDEATLTKNITSGGGSGLTAYVDEVDQQPLLDKLPEPGSIVKRETRGDVGITEWTLSNGIRVVVKPTDFKADEVRFTASSQGAASVFPAE